MIIEIPKISEGGSRYAGDLPASILQLEPDRRIRVDGPISCDFFAQVVSRELIVQGTLVCPAQMQCSRCAEFYSTSLSDSAFLRAYTLAEGMISVDLTADIRESILLEIPTVSRCTPDCKGLCPYCGLNLNRGQCRCRPPAAGATWSGLDKLKWE